MGIIKTKGIILAGHNMGDYDKMVTLLTPDLGKIGCAAKGARRPKSTLMAGTQFLCFGDFLVYKGASSYNINSCEPIEIFYNLRLDIEKLTYASKIAKIVNDVTDENQNTYRILKIQNLYQQFLKLDYQHFQDLDQQQINVVVVEIKKILDILVLKIRDLSVKYAQNKIKEHLKLVTQQ